MNATRFTCPYCNTDVLVDALELIEGDDPDDIRRFYMQLADQQLEAIFSSCHQRAALVRRRSISTKDIL